jgi:DNA segregation ATPase FtsK/SpoIIIE, S-DNA-T family
MFEKTKLKNLFIQGGLFTEIPFHDKKIRKYPTILKATKNDKRKDTYVFQVPLTMNPEEVWKKQHMFTSQFGRFAELEEKNGIFTLTVPKVKLKNKIPFDFTELEPLTIRKKLPIITGYNTTGGIHAYDMVEHPHLLISGETGAGKSSFLRSMLLCLIETCQDRLILKMADFKRVEFFTYEDVNLCEVVYDVPGLKTMLEGIKRETEKRQDILNMHKCRHIDDYNKKFPDTKLKYLILCIDEFVLLKKEAEIKAEIEKLSCIGRALGIFLIISMQRPDAKAIDGQLKNNLTVRVSFQQSSAINSSIALNDGGEVDASKIERPGQFYLKLNKVPKLYQCPFLEDEMGEMLLARFRVKREVESTTDDEPKEESTSSLWGKLE